MIKSKVPCWSCGTAVLTDYNNRSQDRVFCKICLVSYRENKAENLKEYVRLKTVIMHERAMRMLEKQTANLYEYKEPSEIVLEHSLSKGSFASSHEMVAAMELIRKRVKVKSQQTVGNYRVDFMLPEREVILEVDGHTHRHRMIRDSKRDIDLRHLLGKEWEVIRIPTDEIEKSIQMLLFSIEVLADQKRDLRSRNKGILPDAHSEREYKYYRSLIEKRYKEEIEQE